jgi:hypothetical protein
MHGPVYRRPRHHFQPPVWRLRHRSRILVRVVPDDASPLWRIQWPDIGLSAPANAARCMDAAQQWAERKFVAEHRKNGAARSLKSLNKFSWSRSLVSANKKNDPECGGEP